MRKLIGLALLVAFMSVILVVHVSAEDADPIVEIYDSTFTTKTDYFPTCPVTVGIKTYSNVGPYDVILVKPDNTTVILATEVTAGEHNFTYMCNQTGWWQAKAGSATIPFAVGTFFVIYDVPMGVVAALVACFAGLGVKQLQTKMKKTI